MEKLGRIDCDDSKERLHILLSCIVPRNLGNTRLTPGDNRRDSAATAFLQNSR